MERSAHHARLVPLKGRVLHTLRTTVLCGVITAILSACATYITLTEGVKETDLTSIQLGANRETVERILGRPVEHQNNVYTYEYDRGLKFGCQRDAGGCHPLLKAAAPLVDVFGFPLQPVLWKKYYHEYKAQRGRLKIEYGSDDTVTRVSYLSRTY